MSDLTKYLGNKIIRYLAGNVMPTPPSSIYVALFDGNPRSGGTEVTTDVRSDGRVAPTWTVPAANASDNVLVTSVDTSFGNSENDVDITHAAIFDAATGGNMLAAKALPQTAAVTTGALVKFAAGKLRFTIGE